MKRKQTYWHWILSWWWRGCKSFPSQSAYRRHRFAFHLMVWYFLATSWHFSCLFVYCCDQGGAAGTRGSVIPASLSPVHVNTGFHSFVLFMYRMTAPIIIIITIIITIIVIMIITIIYFTKMFIESNKTMKKELEIRYSLSWCNAKIVYIFCYWYFLTTFLSINATNTT